MSQSSPNGSPLKEAEWKDLDGRYWRVLLPRDAPEWQANRGIPIGPPSLASLGLPLDVEVRLHNQLYSRRLYTSSDVIARRQDVLGSIIGALKLDIQRIVDLYSTIGE